jgi:hypothetical protein
MFQTIMMIFNILFLIIPIIITVIVYLNYNKIKKELSKRFDNVINTYKDTLSLTNNKDINNLQQLLLTELNNKLQAIQLPSMPISPITMPSVPQI